jgi:tetratricopeptide (TPR) repeat protein
MTSVGLIYGLLGARVAKRSSVFGPELVKPDTAIHRFVFLASFCCTLLSGVLYGQTTSYGDLIAAANEQARQGDLLQCVSTAQSAIKSSPDKFEGYYLCGFCLYKQSLLQDALGYAQKSLERAPADSKAQVEKLISAISGEITYEEQKQIGDQAYQRGLWAKAASSYADAWRAAKNHADIGLEAAEILDNKLNRPLDSALILNEITAHPQDATNLSKANQLLSDVRPKVLAEGHRQLKAGQLAFDGGNYSSAKEPLGVAASALPESTPDLLLSRIYAREGNLDKAIAELSAASLKTPLQLDFFDSVSEFDAYLNNLQFLQFLADSLGGDPQGIGKQIRANLAMRLAEMVKNTAQYGGDTAGSEGRWLWYKIDQGVEIAETRMTLTQTLSSARSDGSGGVDAGKDAVWTMECSLRIEIPLSDIDLSSLTVSQYNDPPPNVPPFWVKGLILNEGFQPPLGSGFTVQSKTQFAKHASGNGWGCMQESTVQRVYFDFLGLEVLGQTATQNSEGMKAKATNAAELFKRVVVLFR